MNENIELRTDGANGLTLEGYASTFNIWYPIGPGVEERMRSGAFKRSLGEGPAVALRVEHSALPLAHTKSGTLALSEDQTGLLTVASLNARDPDVQGLQAKAENSPLQMSFAFRCNKDSWDEERSRREVIEAGLHKGDVSIVCYGANETTSMSINARNGASTLEQRRAFAERIRGFTAGPRWGLGVETEEPRGRSQIAVPSYVGIARAKAARARLRAGSQRAHPGSDSSVEGSEDAPRYTRAEIDALGEKGLAFKSRSGKYSYPITSKTDLMNALAAFKLGRYAPADKSALRTFIIRRAVVMGLAEELPSGWAHPAAKPGLKEAGAGTSKAVSVGQSQ